MRVDPMPERRCQSAVGCPLMIVRVCRDPLSPGEWVSESADVTHWRQQFRVLDGYVGQYGLDAREQLVVDPRQDQAHVVDCCSAAAEFGGAISLVDVGQDRICRKLRDAAHDVIVRGLSAVGEVTEGGFIECFDEVDVRVTMIEDSDYLRLDVAKGVEPAT